MMVYATCVRKIHLEDGSVVDNLSEIRERLCQLQQRAIDPQYVYTHDWEEGDPISCFSITTGRCIPLSALPRMVLK